MKCPWWNDLVVRCPCVEMSEWWGVHVVKCLCWSVRVGRWLWWGVRGKNAVGELSGHLTRVTKIFGLPSLRKSFSFAAQRFDRKEVPLHLHALAQEVRQGGASHHQVVSCWPLRDGQVGQAQDGRPPGVRRAEGEDGGGVLAGLRQEEGWPHVWPFGLWLHEGLPYADIRGGAKAHFKVALRSQVLGRGCLGIPPGQDRGDRLGRDHRDRRQKGTPTRQRQVLRAGAPHGVSAVTATIAVDCLYFFCGKNLLNQWWTSVTLTDADADCDIGRSLVFIIFYLSRNLSILAHT